MNEIINLPQSYTKNQLEIDKRGIIELNLPTLKRTYREVNAQSQSTLNNVLHFQLIENMLEICQKQGLNAEVQEIFAADNRGKYPGISLTPDLELLHGEKAPEAHTIRRVYTTININDGETKELTTSLVIAYHQDGIQIGFGPKVKMCKNLCMLSADRILKTNGRDGVTLSDMYESVRKWMESFFEYQETDRRILSKMKEIICTCEDVYKMIGLLTSIRVGNEQRMEEFREIKIPPLTQSQISMFTLIFLNRYKEMKEENPNAEFTLWDVYNIGTEIHKPHFAEVPNIINQNYTWADVLIQGFNLLKE